MNGRVRHRAGSRGAALIAAMMYLSALTLFAAGFLSMIHVNLRTAGEAEARQVAMNLAEAGIDRALAGLRADPAGYRGEQDTPLGPGTFSVEVEPLAEPNAYAIRASGSGPFPSRRQSSARVTARVTLGTGGAPETLEWVEARYR